MAQELEARRRVSAELEAFVAHGRTGLRRSRHRRIGVHQGRAGGARRRSTPNGLGALSLVAAWRAPRAGPRVRPCRSKAYQLYQALAIAEATISTYRPPGRVREAWRPVVGAIMAATAVAAGMARVAAIKSTPLKGFAFGGLIGGQDKGERADNVLIRATPGEYMLDRPTVRHYGVSALEALRRRSVPRELLEPFASPRLPASGGKRTAYALGGEIGNGSLTEGGKASGNEGLTVINVMDFQREFDRALASTRGRRVLINILGEEGIAS
ncbi:MAG: hypothetical protein ACLR7Z_21190 [Bilophila wadsworthia]